MPNHIQALSCIEKTGPVVAPSANISGRPSATQPSHIEEDFGENFPILYGGSCQQGVESTILYPTESGWKIVRLGVISPENLKKVLGYSVLASQEQQLLWKKNKVPVAPGQKYRHYAPETKLILGIQYNGEPNVLGFAERNYPEAKQIIVLGSLSHPEEIAARLYDQLRQLDQLGIKEIWVDCDFPQEGILRTIHERLERASHKE
jgi:L-threonylcarbamoyladenylate synthase